MGIRNKQPKLPKIFFTPDPDTKEPVYEVPGLLERVLKSLRDVRYVMTIKIYRADRSLEQNAYMWGVVYEKLSKHTGYTPREIDQIYGEMFRQYEKNGHTFIKSTKEFNTVQMEDYLSEVRQHASEFHHLYIEMPNEGHWTDA